MNANSGSAPDDDHDLSILVRAARALRAKGQIAAAERAEASIAYLRSMRGNESLHRTEALDDEA